MDTNPYQPPQSELSIDNSSTGLASPWIRLGAAIIDVLVLLPINIVLQKIFLKIPTPAEILAAVQSGKTVEAIMPSVGSMLLVNLLGFAALIAVNFNLLKKGQTVGKMLLKLQVQRRTDGTLLPVKDIITRRLLPVYGLHIVASAISPTLGFLAAIAVCIDALCIFRRDRNTIHDDIAGTKVVVLKA
jgi:uncharacterized RDD family membrane protein YckC